MKKISIVFYFFLIAVTFIEAQNYSAKLRVEDLYWYQYVDSSPEWRYDIFADLYLDGVLLDTNSQYTYDWRKKIDAGNWTYVGRFNHNDINGDGQSGMRVYLYAVISGTDFSVISDTVEIKLDGQRSIVNLAAKLQNGNNLQPNNYLRLFTNPHWSAPFFDYSSGNYIFAVTKSTTVPIKVEPYDLPQYNQKFNYWNTTDKIINYYDYITFADNSNLTAHFTEKRKNISLQVNLNEYPNSVKIGFKDPWLVDTLISTNLGMRNRGTQAQFKYNNLINFISNSFYNYKGVLLNQNPNFLPNAPNYQISIDQNININGKQHKLYPIDWDVTNAQIQYPNKLTTGVVFTNDNAVVTANLKGSLISNTASAFANSGQHKVITTQNGTMYLTYESMNSVWLEKSTDNGTTWQLPYFC